MAKILLVEDDTNLSEIYQARMEAEGYAVVSASDGEAALAVAAKERPDLIISDVMMPKISGFEMLDILRNTDGLKDTPVIMLTALGQADDKTRADSLGADRYLVKSQVTLEDIVNAAHALLEGGEATKAAPGSSATSSDSTGSDDSKDATVISPTEAPTVPTAPPTPVTDDKKDDDKPNEKPAEKPSEKQDEAPETVSLEVKVEPVKPEPKPEVKPEPPADTKPVVQADEPAAPHKTAAALDGAVIDDKIVAHTVDRLLNKTPQVVQPSATPAAQPKPTATVANDGPTPVHHEPGSMRTIQPMSESEKPKRSLQELLAEEEQREAAAMNQPATPATPAAPAASAAPAAIPTDSAEPTTPSKPADKPVDPNSIAL